MNHERFFIRRINSLDKEGLKKGMERLSRESRRQRFFSSRAEFTDEELTFYTEVDQYNHLALVAIDQTQRLAEPAGSIRCVRDIKRSNYAELAITIIDRYHGLGLGGKLMEALATEALRVGISHFYGDFHTSNIKMLKVLEKYCLNHKIERAALILNRQSDGFLAFEMPLTENSN